MKSINDIPKSDINQSGPTALRLKPVDYPLLAGRLTALLELLAEGHSQKYILDQFAEIQAELAAQRTNNDRYFAQPLEVRVLAAIKEEQT